MALQVLISMRLFTCKEARQVVLESKNVEYNHVK